MKDEKDRETGCHRLYIAIFEAQLRGRVGFYMRFRISIRGHVRRFVRPSVHPSLDHTQVEFLKQSDI